METMPTCPRRVSVSELVLVGLIVLISMIGLGLAGCQPEPAPAQAEEAARDLEPYANRFAAESEMYRPQPERVRPGALELSADSDTLYIALKGTIDEPQDEVVALDLDSRTIRARYRVGQSPTGLALHPDGRHLVVTNRFSNYLSIIDLQADKVERHRSDFYLVEPLFSADGRRLYVTNHRRNSLQVFDVARDGAELSVTEVAASTGAYGVPVGENPRDLELLEDGKALLVAAVGGMTVSYVDTDELVEVDLDDDPSTTDFAAPAGVTRLDIGAPVHDVAVFGDYLYVATQSKGSGHPALQGPDIDGDGVAGDSTPNVEFQDMQNEIAVYRLPDLSPVVRYTSDTICCFDFRDVAPEDELGHLLPPRAQWIVGGALPEQIAAFDSHGEPALVVTYSGSNQVQRFDIGADGRLSAGPVVATGFMPTEVLVNEARTELYVSDHLGDSLTIIDPDSFEVSDTVDLGDAAEPYPATDAEIGELVFFSGAAFSVDGDRTCAHCHPDGGNIAKPFNLPGLADKRGSRMTPHSRGLFETRPWLLGGVLDETNFFEPLNAFTRDVNFCCYDFRPSPLSPTLGQADCVENPPSVCSQRRPPRDMLTRDHFFLDRAQTLLGRQRSLGDAIDTKLDFLGVTRLVGLFLIHEPALLPNPNPADAPAVERGRRLFNSPETGCAVCHPAPGFTTTYETMVDGLPLHFGPLITVARDDQGANLDQFTGRFMRNFPFAEQTDEGALMLNPPTLRGLWERAGPLLHDGRARNLREALATPGHPGLEPGEVGYNERDGMFDTHGGTSHLSADELADLIVFLRTL